MSKNTRTLEEAALLLGYSVNTLRTWIAKGCPVVAEGGRGKGWRLSIPDVIEWRAHQAVNHHRSQTPATQELRRRKLAAEVEIAEREAQQRLDQVAPVAELTQAWSSTTRDIRQTFAALAEQIAPALIGLPTEAEIKHALRAAIDDQLTTLGQAT